MEPLWRLIERRIPSNARDVRLEVCELPGGLTSASVVHVLARFVSEDGRKSSMRCVLKNLDGDSVREARVYERILSVAGQGLAPILYGVHTGNQGPTHLCLEAIAPLAPWPWKDLNFARAVLERVSTLHGLSPKTGMEHLGDWDYDAELEHAADQTLMTIEPFRKIGMSPEIERSLPALRRVRRHLPAIRRELHRFSPLPVSIIHGDLHPGNVVVRRGAGGAEPILIDWARSRVGSPLEDVASWLQWLGFWEPLARRKHDSLLGAYLRARGLAHLPSRAVRKAYWLAGALNSYAGVMTYYLSVATETGPGDPKYHRALAAVHDCLRVVRRADAYLRQH